MSNKNEENSSEEHNNIEGYFTKKHKVYPVAQTLKLVVAIAAIALFIDVQNYPSILIDKFGMASFSLGIATILAIAGITAYEDGLLKQLTLPFINRLDNLAALGLYLSVVCFFERQLLLGYDWPYKNELAIITIICFICMLIRFARVTAVDEVLKAENHTQIVYDFEKVYLGGLSIPKGERFIISDEEAPNDLFGRDRLINHLESLIASGSANDGCVISLQGKWGAGKTTLVNYVKEKVTESHGESDEKIIWIDEFDPWNYKDEEALVTSLLDAIIKSTGIHYQSNYFNKAAATLAKLILKTDSNAIDDIFRKDITLKKFKEQINDCLKASNKKVVMVIDNLDRIDEEKLILIFDVIGNHLKFDNVTYLLLFDHERVGEVFKSRPHLGYEYVNKIITVPITLPKLDNTKAKEVYGTALDNIFKAYNLDENIGEYDALLDTMLTLEINPRNFKQFLNSGVIPFCAENYGLYLRDLIYLSFIKQFNYELYEEIYRYKKYCVVEAPINEQFIQERLEMGDNTRTKFFNDLKAKADYGEYTKIIDKIFLIHEYDWEVKVAYARYNLSICNGYVFDLYFTATSNQYSLAAKKIKEFIQKINESSNRLEKETYYKKWMENNNYSEKNELVNQLSINLSKVQDTRELVRMMWTNVGDTFDNHCLSKSYLLVEIEGEILLTMSDDEVRGIVNDLSYFKQIAQIINIYYFFERKIVEGVIDAQNKLKIIQQKINQMSAEIFINQINLLDEEVYMVQNLSWLFRYNKKEKNKCNEYIQFLLDEDKRNIFKILYEAVECRESNNDVYNYKINYNSVDLVIDNDVIDEAMSKVERQTENEQIIYELYKLYKANKHTGGMSSTTPHVSSKHLLKY